MSDSRFVPGETAEARAEKIAGLCAQVTKTSKGWRACCPVHDDQHPSLDIDPGTDRVLLICRSAGCNWRNILSALMLKPADLFCHPKAHGWDTHIEDVYNYEDEHGTVLFQVRRVPPRGTRRKQFPQFHPDPAAPDGWSKDVEGVRRVLYHLPEVLAAIARGEPIYLAEGEKDVDNLRKLGVTATCNPGGASKGRNNKKWLPEYTEMLRGADCYLLPDHDQDGADHVKTVAAHLQDIAKSVRIVPGIHTEAVKSDVSDWLAAGHTRVDLEAAVAASPLHTSLPETVAAVTGGVTTLLENHDGSPKAALGNVLAVLTKDTLWQEVLGYNALSDEVMFLKCPPCYADKEGWKPRPLEDHDDAEIANWLEWTYGIFCRTTVVHEGIQAAAHRNTYHPIRDYLHSLKWDKTARLDTWLPTYCGAENTPYTQAVGTQTLIGAVARVMQPGCKMDTCTTLIGAQGTLKSTAVRVLCGDAWFSDTMPEDLHDKDAMQGLRGKWIIEFADLASFHRSQIETVKRFLSATQDYYRPSYGRRARTFLRQNIFVGTTNKEEFLKDETGNRRFYPIATKGMCDTAALVRDRDQLWAEAMERYGQGEAWHLDPAMELTAAVEQAQYMEHDPWEESVLTYAEGKDAVSTKEIMQGAFNWESADKWTKPHSMRIAAILRKHHWKKVRPLDKDTGKTYAAYSPPSKAPSPHETSSSTTSTTSGVTNNGGGRAISPHETSFSTTSTTSTTSRARVEQTLTPSPLHPAPDAKASTLVSINKETGGRGGRGGREGLDTSANTSTTSRTGGSGGGRGGREGLDASAVQSPPCVDCGGIVRWQDGAVLRCVACWPPGTSPTKRDL